MRILPLSAPRFSNQPKRDPLLREKLQDQFTAIEWRALRGLTITLAEAALIKEALETWPEDQLTPLNFRDFDKVRSSLKLIKDKAKGQN
jgi:hypothetical protein